MSNIDEDGKNPFKPSYLDMIRLMEKYDGDTERVAKELGKTVNGVDQMFLQLRKKYDKARIVVNTYEAWRRKPCLRKRLF